MILKQMSNEANLLSTNSNSVFLLSIDILYFMRSMMPPLVGVKLFYYALRSRVVLNLFPNHLTLPLHFVSLYQGFPIPRFNQKWRIGLK